MKNRNTIFAAILFVFALLCAAAAPKAFGVDPAPDGGYPGINTAEGDDALFNLTTGVGNTAVGFNALFGNTSGSYNTATGVSALQFNTEGSNNTANGVDALFSNTIGNNNTASGQEALENNLGDNNTATGAQALLNNVDGTQNTANGVAALLSNTSGNSNTANGFSALRHNLGGSGNTASGRTALQNNTTGSDNTATGLQALFSNTTGNSNTADGFDALFQNTGNNNTALGSNAGANLTTGNNNIDIGANVTGAAGEANTIRIGKSGTQTKALIAGISGKTVANGVGVIVGSTGQLGTVVSSARFKEAIRPMDKASEAIFALKPVTFRYKKELDPDKIPQFGLIAEEVEKVNPGLVARDEEGKIMSVRYEAVNAMLLNEFLKEHKRVEAQQATISELKSTVAQQQKGMEVLTAQLKEQAAQIQKVSAQVEISRPAPRVVSHR